MGDTANVPANVTITDPVAILFILALVVLGSIWLEKQGSIFKKLGSAATVILIALVLSNLAVIPGESPVYDFLMGRGVLAGIVLILLNVNLGSIRAAGRPMLVAFALGAMGSALGAVLMAAVLRPAIGPDTWKLSGQFTGTYIGGGMNFAAIGQALETRSDLFAAGIAADVIVTAIWLVACLVIPEMVAPQVASQKKTLAIATEEAGPAASDLGAQLETSGAPMTLTDFAGLTTITLGTITASEALAGLVPAIPKVIWLTTLSLGLAHMSFVRRLTGSVVLGNFLVLLFLASNGAKSVISHIVAVGPGIFYFAAGVVAIHGIIIFGIGRALKLNGDLLSIASQANVGGSTTAMALAGARRRPDLILPGFAVGMLGNALGNYAGMAIAYLTRTLVG
ncbi:MAG: DUF819 family protein [Vicinamibacteria bacterium]|nr:DUF819 family protein [Vicinamibacteria bacterium]